MALKPTGKLMRGVVHDELGTDSKHAISQKIVTDELNKKVPTARKINGKALTADVTLAAGEVGAYTKAEVDAKVGAVVPKTAVVQATGTSTTNIMSQKATTDQLNTKVPTARKINGKALTSDITLSSADVGTYTKAEIDTKVNGRVPTTRKVNGKVLSADVTLSAADVGAYAKAEVDAKVGAVVPKTTTINGKPLSANVTITLAELGGVSSSGEVNSAVKLKTPRTINGTDFDGTGNITTSSWGTPRNITIGNTTKSVDGSANVSWNLNEIGLGGLENKKWVELKSGSMSIGLTTGTNVYKGTVNTGLKTDARTFDQSRYRVVLETGGNVENNNSVKVWWSCRGEVVPRQHLSAGNQLWIDVYCSGEYVLKGYVTKYTIYEWK